MFRCRRPRFPLRGLGQPPLSASHASWAASWRPEPGLPREVLGSHQSPRRPAPQDRHRLHQACRPDPRPGRRCLAGRPPGSAEVHRPPYRRARRLLFAIRARRVSTHYINNTIIPMLCRKAGVPDVDVRGNITSHRARSTIASQLYNAKEPMTLFELQARLGHRSPRSTQYYAKITPSTLSKAYSEAGYFERNVRTIEVLVDRGAVASGAAAAGEPWQHYDLGHGYCTYTFFEQCQHRMACAKCDFYTPKGSIKSQILEAKGNLQRMLVTIPLTDDERQAVDDGQTALDKLLPRPRRTAGHCWLITEVGPPAAASHQLWLVPRFPKARGTH
ncbi:tyrosine-type recombinase/integrase [Streptomyces xanthochromogenes]|uniref:tyrosine-type recombinase/integrase n=1 Tax=Streptomyces xanthochromogenes TaxID=67384 RepID=UPI0038166F5D